MDNIKIIYGIDILDYCQMIIKLSGKWFIETSYTKEQLDRIIKAMFKKKEKLAYFSLKGLTDELEQGGYFKIIEDLTGIAQHTLEFEVEERILIG